MSQLWRRGNNGEMDRDCTDMKSKERIPNIKKIITSSGIK